MKIYKPTTPGRRGMAGIDFSELSKKRPEKKLLRYVKRRAGRGSSGRITIRHKGGGAKRLYRVIEFSQTKMDLPAKVIALEYDPNRTAFLALIEYPDGVRQYILSPHDLKVGQSIIFSESAPMNPGNRIKLKNAPVGTSVYNIELNPGSGGKIVRSAGSSAQVLVQDGKFTNIKMPSSEIR